MCVLCLAPLTGPAHLEDAGCAPTPPPVPPPTLLGLPPVGREESSIPLASGQGR
jgi:hypothetical protein